VTHAGDHAGGGPGIKVTHAGDPQPMCMYMYMYMGMKVTSCEDPQPGHHYAAVAILAQMTTKSPVKRPCNAGPVPPVDDALLKASLLKYFIRFAIPTSVKVDCEPSPPDRLSARMFVRTSV
jgi:hypothetical protein